MNKDRKVPGESRPALVMFTVNRLCGQCRVGRVRMNVDLFKIYSPVNRADKR
ncbi:hypothetical protein PMIN01_06796 [Paraphaeosphaeria minitans]|uniref:Uncharacterized protein n=1 Tax=Paraphaeosphaeria minitans TaxID=565426 RepID=A0A9P6GHR0_9PLEO|nr:hypothetical protein PMIN01_06796 [Paraphaeosphaeria minitans]